jgi:hypothetical protein
MPTPISRKMMLVTADLNKKHDILYIYQEKAHFLPVVSNFHKKWGWAVKKLIVSPNPKEPAVKTKQFAVIVFVALIGGIIGGIVSNQIFSENFAFAQNEKPQKVLRAEKFELVDDEGNIRAELFCVGDMASLRIGRIDEAHYLVVQKPLAVVSLVSSENTRNRISLSSAEDGAKLVLNEQKGGARLEANLVLNGDPSIRLRDINGRNRIIGTTKLKDMESPPELIRP